MDVFIKAISYHLPEKRLTNDELSELFPEWDVNKIASKIGINERRITNENELASDLALNAAEKLFNQFSVNRNDIDFLLYCTQSPDYFLPSTSCILQNKLGLSKSIGALDFNLGCSGYVYGLSLAKGLILSGSAKNVLLITSETYSKYLHPKDKGNRTIFGDAAAATLISSENGFAEINNFIFGTDGAGYKQLIVKNGAGVNPYSCEMKHEELNDEGKNDNFLFMDGKEIFTFTADNVPVLVKDTLERNNLSQEDIDLFVFHQANKYMLNFIRKRINIPEHKFYNSFELTGNTVSSTIPIALVNAIEDNKLKGNVLLAGFGVGLSLAGVTLRCK